MTTSRSPLGIILCVSFVLGGCADTPTSTRGGSSLVVGRSVEAAVLAPEDFVPRSDNVYFPLVPGTTFRYESRTADGLETESFTVTFRTKVIQGVRVRVVEDVVRLDGVITEHTFDWLAQNVETGD